MSPECLACGRKVRCPVSIPHTPIACRIIKWLAATGYVIAYGLIYRTTATVVEYKLAQELGTLLLFRTTIITALFITTMWAMNHLIACAERGGFPAKDCPHE